MVYLLLCGSFFIGKNDKFFVKIRKKVLIN